MRKIVSPLSGLPTPFPRYGSAINLNLYEAWGVLITGRPQAGAGINYARPRAIIGRPPAGAGVNSAQPYLILTGDS